MNRRIKAGVAVVVSVVGLSTGACYGTPAYVRIGEKGSPYGYTDAPSVEGGHTIRVTFPYSSRDPELAYVYWNRRAAEICNGAIARKQIHTAQQTVMHAYNRMNGIVGDYLLEGYVWCETPGTPAGAPTAVTAAP
jgi:hypothetical protein